MCICTTKPEKSGKVCVKSEWDLTVFWFSNRIIKVVLSRTNIFIKGEPKVVKTKVTLEFLNENVRDYEEFDEQNLDWVIDEHDTSWMDLFDELHQYQDVCSTCGSVIICER